MSPSSTSQEDPGSKPSPLSLDSGNRSRYSPVVSPLLPEHLDNVLETQNSAFKEDPLRLFIRAGKEWSPFRNAIYKRLWRFQKRRDLREKLAYTVDAGDAVIIVDSSKPSSISRALNSIVLALLKIFVLYPEQVKRANEFELESSRVIKNELGDKTEALFVVDLLATKPEKQGHGYATALLKSALFSADLHGRATYLFSSNTANVAFYESFDFVRTADILLGADNPKWEHPPVIVSLMVRPARTRT